MFILIDSRIPIESKEKLNKYGEIIEFSENNLVYKAISGHPDIFCCQTPEYLIVAPEINREIIQIFEEKNINFIFGNKNLGSIYPLTAFYNAVVSEKYIIHNIKITDNIILEHNISLKKISVNQGYTRCNLIVLDDDYFITSDRGIFNKLYSINQEKVLYINPQSITLPHFKHGFFGGCCGYFNKTLFIIGNIKYLPERLKLFEFIEKSGNNIINLGEHQLFDGGGIFFITK